MKLTKKRIKELFQAIERGDVANIEEFLDAWPDQIDVYGEHNRLCRDKTSLMYALQCMNLELAGWLLDHGANPNAVMPAGPQESVIHMCVERAFCRKADHDDWIAFTERLIDAGVNPSDALWPALNAFGGIVDRPDLIIMLNDRGADPDTFVGDTAVRALVAENARLYPAEILQLFNVEVPAKQPTPDDASDNTVILEHPSGECHNAFVALSKGFRKVRELQQERDDPVSVSVQGGTSRGIQDRTLTFQNGVLEFPRDELTDDLLKRCEIDVDSTLIETDQAGDCRFVANATPKQMAAVVMVLMTEHFKLPKYKQDYAVGFEWQ